jgi:hypothetical protein
MYIHTYRFLVPVVGRWLDYPSHVERIRELKKHLEFEDRQLKNHVVILGFNESGQELAEYFRMKKKEVFVVDLDPSLHRAFTFAYKGVRGHRVARCPPIDNIVSAHAERMQMLKQKFSARKQDNVNGSDKAQRLNDLLPLPPETENVANTTTHTRGQEESVSHVRNTLTEPSRDSVGLNAEVDSLYLPLPGATSASPDAEVQVMGQGFGLQDPPRPTQFGAGAEMSRRGSGQWSTRTCVVGQGFGQDEAAGHEVLGLFRVGLF